MVQRVTVSPSEVRGYGDIVSPKTTEDFTEYMCELSESDGVYTLAYEDTTTYLRLSANPTSLQYLGQCDLYATLKVDGALAVGETVSFYDGETLLGTGETDNQGIAHRRIYTSTFLVGTHSIHAVYDELESNTVSVTVVKTTSSVSLSSDKSTVSSSESFTLSGRVLAAGVMVVSEGNVKIYNGNTLVDTVQTDSQGLFSKTITGASVGTNTYHAVFEGNEYCNGSTSSDVDVFVIGGSYIGLEVTGDSFSSYNNAPFTYTGSVVIDWGDNSGLDEYAGGQLNHTYSSSDDYTVKIYGNITSLDTRCFYGCTGVTSITIPNTVTSFGSGCFRGCTGLTSVSIPNTVTSIGDSCFKGCTGLTGITLPNSITSMGDGCFNGCTGLTSVTLPNTITSLGVNYFGGCTGLTSINIPNTVTNLGDACFNECTGLISITLPINLTTLGNGCFDTCTGLTTLTIPDSVTSIDNYCFVRCSNLAEIVLLWDSSSEIITYNSTWHSISGLNHFLIPQGTKSLYTAKNYPSALLKEDGEPTPATITLTGTKSILSYTDSESSVLTATVLDDNDDPVEGVSVDLYKANVLWDTLTTDSNGTVSKTYTSAGIGDISFKAECGSLVTETYTVQDCLFYDSLTTNKSRYTTISGTPVISYSSNGLTVNSNVASVGLTRNNALTLPTNYQAEITISQQNSGYGGGICFDDMLLDSGAPNKCTMYKLSNTSILANDLPRFETGDVVKIVKNGTSLSYYLNDDLKTTVTITDDTHYQQFRTYQNRPTTYKDLKIKPL